MYKRLPILFRLITVLSLSWAFALPSWATTVQFQTSLGEFEVILFDADTPETVDNFLQYVNSDAYTDTIIHRAVDGFVVQGGGFSYTDADGLAAIEAVDPVMNEPVFSNVAGTIAMAKIGGNPHSATNQWFFNLSDNSANLDVQNGGFTVFGQVVEGSLSVLNSVASIDTYILNGMGDFPLFNYTADDANNNVAITKDNMIQVYAIVVIDSASDTASGLSPTPNTLINRSPDQPSNDSSDGSGSTTPLLIALLCALAVFRRTKNHV